jgi:hypothetical protein
MIRIILRGRTGNILFEYALGRALAAKHGVPLALDASWYNSAGWAEVSHFLRLPLQAKVVRHMPLAARALRKFTKKHYWEFRGLPVLRENPDDQSFEPSFPAAPSDCVLFGYFQTPRYFESMAEELRAELKSLIERGAGTSRPHPVPCQLTRPNSIAVHVRRGDYLRMPDFQVCDEAYHRQAMDQMRARVSNARFFIFSDDPGWCRSTFTESDCEVIDSGPAAANPLHDLHLMSLAGHHIIANSSYSWWAAWLGDKPEQRVIMPDRWYARNIIAPMSDKSWK